MDTKKFEYLETIREAIELGDYEELKEFVDDIRDVVKMDPDFEEIFMEVSTGKYQEVIPLIDDIIYKEMQSEYDSLEEEVEEEYEESKPGKDPGGFTIDFDFDEELKEEISFEPFDEEGYFDKGDEDAF